MQMCKVKVQGEYVLFDGHKDQLISYDDVMVDVPMSELYRVQYYIQRKAGLLELIREQVDPKATRFRTCFIKSKLPAIELPDLEEDVLVVDPKNIPRGDEVEELQELKTKDEEFSDLAATVKTESRNNARSKKKTKKVRRK